MYEFYYFEKEMDDSENHVIHRASCTYLPRMEKRTVLSYDRSSLSALDNAEIEYLGMSFSICPFCYTSLNIK